MTFKVGLTVPGETSSIMVDPGKIPTALKLEKYIRILGFRVKP
jgi:hypothetical protein